MRRFNSRRRAQRHVSLRARANHLFRFRHHLIGMSSYRMLRAEHFSSGIR